MTDKEKISILTQTLVSLHTARWTGNQKLFAYWMDKIGAFSYARTNGWEDEDTEDYMIEKTLESLKYNPEEYDKG